LSRKDRGHGFGGESTRNRVSQSIRKSLMKRLQWQLLDHWRNSMGTSIRVMVGSGSSWPLLADGWPAMLLLHRTRDMIIRDQMETVLQEEPLTDWCSRGENSHTKNATRE
jgi:hypothetical protein